MTYLEELKGRLLSTTPEMDPIELSDLMIEACDVLEAMEVRVARMEARIEKAKDDGDIS